MTKKYYEKIAKVVHNHRSSFDYHKYVDFVNDLCVIFEESNDRFDSDKFHNAVKIYE